MVSGQNGRKIDERIELCLLELLEDFVSLSFV